MEAIDKKNSSLICVASVVDTLGDKVLVHFDSWEDNYDYWCDMTSPLIHPIGYCEENDLVLSPPQGKALFLINRHSQMNTRALTVFYLNKN